MRSFGLGRDGLANARLHSGSPSKTLRSQAVGACRWCGAAIEWFDRHDGGRIPLTPMEFPEALVPTRYRWAVDGGVARPGSYGRIDHYCRLAHPVICPAADHADLDERLHPLVQLLGVRMRSMIDAGEFTPQPMDGPATEDAVQDDEPAVLSDGPPIRHVLAYSGRLRIAPGPIADLRCVALDEDTMERCDRGVFDAEEGQWEQIPVPAPAGRRRLATYRGSMWVWELKPLAYLEALRWLRQHCPVHHGTAAPNAVAVEFADFVTDRHAPFITHLRPAGYEVPGAAAGAGGGVGAGGGGTGGPGAGSGAGRGAGGPAGRAGAAAGAAGPGARARAGSGPGAGAGAGTGAGAGAGWGDQERTRCAGEDCFNATVVAVAPGWLCYRCAGVARRRSATHRRWQREGGTGPGPAY